MRLKSVTFIFVLFYLLCFFSFNNFRSDWQQSSLKLSSPLTACFLNQYLFFIWKILYVFSYFYFFLEGMCKCHPKVPSESTRGLQSKLRQTLDLAINSSILFLILLIEACESKQNKKCYWYRLFFFSSITLFLHYLHPQLAAMLLKCI